MNDKGSWERAEYSCGGKKTPKEGKTDFKKKKKGASKKSVLGKEKGISYGVIGKKVEQGKQSGGKRPSPIAIKISFAKMGGFEVACNKMSGKKNRYKKAAGLGSRCVKNEGSGKTSILRESDNVIDFAKKTSPIKGRM